MKKNVLRFTFLAKILFVLVALFFAFSCELGEPINTENPDNGQNEDNQIGSASRATWHPVCEYRLYDQPDCTGINFTIWMYTDGERYILNNNANLDLDDFTGSYWDNNVKSIELISHGYYPVIYVFEDPHTPGGLDKVIKVIAQTNNIPAGFGISSVLPEVPQYSSAKQTVRILVDPYIGRLRFLCAENETDRPIKPNRVSGDLWETFRISYIDVNRKFFTLEALANNMYVCADMHKDQTNTLLYANRSSADYWEIFKITQIFEQDSSYRRVTFSALANTKTVRAPGEDIPIGTYGSGETQFHIINITY
jgi:hypothetical protein